jgi:hypothetical protein
MKSLFLSLLILVFQTAIAQVSFSGGGKIMVHGGGKIIITPSPAGITWVAGGGIITADEGSQVVLLIGEDIGEYRVPFVTLGGQTVPFTYRVTTPGIGQGMLVLSSWAVTEDGLVNTLTGGPGLPAEVTTFLTEGQWGNWSVQGGSKVINRFWRIDPVGYTVKPKGEYEFTYHLSEKPAALDESSITAQRWNDVDDTWLDWLYAPTANLATKTVSVIIQNPEDQFPIWTLTDITDPLPIQLARFVGECNGGGVRLSWTTWSELDNAVFIIQRSSDGMSWLDAGMQPGAGTTSTANSYAFYDDIQLHGTLYYRLVDVNSRGERGYGQVIAVSCQSSGSITVGPNPTQGVLLIRGGSPASALLRDIGGRLVKTILIDGGLDLSLLAAGVYTLMFPSGEVFVIIKQ